MDTTKKDKGSLEIFFEFLKNNKPVIIFSIFVILLCYSYRLTGMSYSIDTEVFINNPMQFKASWASLGRYFLYLLSVFFRFSTDINPQFLNILAYFFLMISNLILLYVFFLCGVKSRLSYLVFSGFYLSSPIIIEQTNFIMQAPEVALSTVAISVSVYFMTRYVNTGKMKYPLYSILINVFSFATYSSVFLMFIVLTVIINELDHIDKPYKNMKDYFFSYLPWVIVFLISYVWNYIFTLLSKYYLGGLDGSYISTKLGIFNMKLSDYVATIRQNFFTDILNFHSKYFLWLLPILFILNLLILIFKKEISFKTRFFSCLNMFFLLVFALSGFFIIGQIYPIRSLFPYLPITIAFFAMYCINLLGNRLVKKGAIAILLLLIIGQIKVTSDFCYSAEMVARDEYQLTQKIFNQLDDSVIKNINQYKLIVDGSFSGENPGIIKGDAVGYSFYEWDNSLKTGTTNRVAGYWNSLGYAVQKPTDDEYDVVAAHYLDPSKLVKVEEEFIIVDLNAIN